MDVYDGSSQPKGSYPLGVKDIYDGSFFPQTKGSYPLEIKDIYIDSFPRNLKGPTPWK